MAFYFHSSSNHHRFRFQPDTKTLINTGLDGLGQRHYFTLMHNFGVALDDVGTLLRADGEVFEETAGVADDGRPTCSYCTLDGRAIIPQSRQTQNFQISNKNASQVLTDWHQPEGGFFQPNEYKIQIYLAGISAVIGVVAAITKSTAAFVDEVLATHGCVAKVS